MISLRLKIIFFGLICCLTFLTLVLIVEVIELKKNSEQLRAIRQEYKNYIQQFNQPPDNSEINEKK